MCVCACVCASVCAYVTYLHVIQPVLTFAWYALFRLAPLTVTRLRSLDAGACLIAVWVLTAIDT
jgi:hypothetical protein